MSKFIRQRLRRMPLLTAAVVSATIGALWTPNAAEPSKTSEGGIEKISTYFTDSRDGRKYRAVEIGGKMWMAENLDYRLTNNNKTGKTDNSNSNKYGRVYDWDAALTACPSGWHLPSRQEWDSLGRAACGARPPDWYGAGQRLRTETDWKGVGTDDYGFSALPTGGSRNNAGGPENAEENAFWWTATETEKDPRQAYYRGIWYGNASLSENKGYKSGNFSVRCVRDENTRAEAVSNTKTVTVSSVATDAKGGGRYEPGRTVTVTAGTAAGRRFRKWTSARNDAAFADAFRGTTMFIMPANDVTVTANFDTIIVESGTLTDSRDGKKYKTVAIGNQNWMAKNLDYTPPNGKSWCYDGNAENCDKYGKLYDRETAMTACPDGWHLPSFAEWDNLALAIGSEGVSGWYGLTWLDAGKTLKTTSGWKDYKGKSGNGTDDYGFSALPGGYRSADRRGDDIFKEIDGHGYWWTTKDDGKHVYGQNIQYSDDNMTPNQSGRNNGFSVRCVMNGNVAVKEKADDPWKRESDRLIEEKTEYFTDSRDGRKYRAIKIGGSTWMAENLNYQPTKGESRCYDNDTSNCNKYGRLYDWETAMTVCPSGWYLPARGEWDSLTLAIGGKRRGEKKDEVVWRGAGKKLKTKNGWYWNSDNGLSGNGTDEYGFSAMPGGYRIFDGSFHNVGNGGWWWTAAELNGRAYLRYMLNRNGNVSEDYDNKTNLYSVRCVRYEDKKMEQGKKEAEQKRLDAARRKTEIEQKRIEKLSAYFTDSRDSRKYRVIKIGGKTWMAENLNYKPQDNKSWCYTNDTLFCGKYGRLYDWEAAKTVCPQGWRLPSRQEWNDLGKAVGGESVSGGSGKISWLGAGNKLKAGSDWIWNTENNVSGGGTDDYGFSALPGGKYSTNGKFGDAGKEGSWWVGTDDWRGGAYYRKVCHNGDYLGEEGYDKDVGISVRCVKED